MLRIKKMAKEKRDTFVLELPLKFSPQDSRELNTRLNAARFLYNACLGESLRRIALMKQSKCWSLGRKLKKSPENTKKRSEYFRQAQLDYEFSEYSLHSYVSGTRNACWIKEHIDSSTSQKIATKAFQAAKEYLLRKKGRPRF